MHQLHARRVFFSNYNHRIYIYLPCMHRFLALLGIPHGMLAIDAAVCSNALKGQENSILLILSFMNRMIHCIIVSWRMITEKQVVSTEKSCSISMECVGQL